MIRLNFRFVTWLFVTLFLVAGLPLLLVSDPVTGRFLAMLALLSLGGFAIAMALDARQTGVLNLQHTIINYSNRPWVFKCAATGIGLCGIGLIVTAVVMLLRS